jgi:hypothetical protein
MVRRDTPGRLGREAFLSTCLDIGDFPVSTLRDCGSQHQLCEQMFAKLIAFSSGLQEKNEMKAVDTAPERVGDK